MDRGSSSASRASYRWTVGSRVAAALVGGYAFTWLFAAALAVILHKLWTMPRVDAVLVSTMAAFIVYAIVAMTVIAMHSAWRAWWLLLCGSIVLVAVLIVL